MTYPKIPQNTSSKTFQNGSHSGTNYAPDSGYAPPPPPFPPSNIQNSRERMLYEQQQNLRNIHNNTQLTSRGRENFEIQKEKYKRQLFTAARTGDYKLLEDCFLAGVPANLLEPKTSDTALIIACRLGNSDMVRLCLNFGSKNDPHPDFGQTALHAACAEGQYDSVSVLLKAASVSEADKIICNLTDTIGQTPLHIAAIVGDTEIFSLLLTHGADIFKVDDSNQNVAHLSAYSGESY